MKGLLQNDPRGFVIALYGNIKKILKFFNMPYNNLPIFQYARVVMKNAPSNANPFFNFTRIFTQANYSSNEITLADGINALENYNGFLKILLRKEEPFSVFIKHSLIFLNCIPLFIASKNIKKQY